MDTQKEQVVVVGATGLIGREVVALLSEAGDGRRYSVLGVTRNSLPALDLEDPTTMARFFRDVEGVRHVVVAAGDARFAGFEDLDGAAFEVGLQSKLMGQVNVAMAALRVLPVGGSVTLTSGALSDSPIPGSAAVAMVNGALDSFVRAIALDTPPGRRINVVSPGWIKETMAAMGMDASSGTSARDVARLYVRSIESGLHGEVISDEANDGTEPIEVNTNNVAAS